jgi:hypothetical protein
MLMREVTAIEDLVCEDCCFYNPDFGQCGKRWLDARDVEPRYFCGDGFWYVAGGTRSRAGCIEVIMYRKETGENKPRKKKKVDKQDDS